MTGSKKQAAFQAAGPAESESAGKIARQDCLPHKPCEGPSQQTKASVPPLPGYFTPDIRRTVGLRSRTIAMAAAMAIAAVMANRVGIVMDP